MILKVERIISVGKFKNFQATGDVAFRKLTLIYGDNGGGKTTLTAIIRALTTKINEIVSRRTSINQSDPQAIRLIERSNSGDTYYTYNHTSGWNNSLPNIEIFDIHFVNENIYSGFDFSDEHRKHLHNFVVGAQGVQIQTQIEQNKISKTESRKLQASLEQQLIQQVGNNLSIDLISSFTAISASTASDIDQQISQAEMSLANANANATIRTLHSLSFLSEVNSGIRFADLVKDLGTTSLIIQDLGLRLIFQDHCKELSDNSISGPEQWLRTGFSYYESRVQLGKVVDDQKIPCPFCKQDLSNSMELISAFTLQFNKEFNALVLRLQNHLRTIQEFNLENELQNLNHLKQSNDQHISTWSNHLDSFSQPVINMNDETESLSSLYSQILEVVEQKLQNPSIALDPENVIVFQNQLERLNSKIVTYNQDVQSFNGSIANFKAGIPEVATARNSLERLKRIKKRFEPQIERLCTQLSNEKSNLTTLERSYSQLIQQQEATATAFFGIYQNRINHYLGTVFKTPFRIESVTHLPPKGRGLHSKIGYKLTIDGHDISFDEGHTNNAKDCLSEGDKSTIALAFFLSKLDIDPNLNNKILVFDDPLSSFDSNRRMYTVQLIKDLFPSIEQAIVLSHNEFFLHELSKGFAAGEKKTLRISENFLTKESIIEPLNIEVLVENDYFKQIRKLENFLQNADVNQKELVLGWLRNVLEAHIKFKFYRQLSTLPENNQTFGRLITELENQGVVFRDDNNRLDIVSKLRMINGISAKPHHGEPSPDYSALGANPNTMNVTELANFVNDTLDLIDNRL